MKFSYKAQDKKGEIIEENRNQNGSYVARSAKKKRDPVIFLYALEGSKETPLPDREGEE